MKWLSLSFLTVCIPIAGCGFFPESMFDLAPDSRLPKCLVMPEGHSRSDTRVEMYYYMDGSVVFFLENKYGMTISKVKGEVKGSTDLLKYPGYTLVTVNGMNELIEHKKPEPIFYINDDPNVWKRFGLSGQDPNVQAQ